MNFYSTLSGLQDMGLYVFPSILYWAINIYPLSGIVAYDAHRELSFNLYLRAFISISCRAISIYPLSGIVVIDPHRELYFISQTQSLHLRLS